MPVRYFAANVDESIAFYIGFLGFKLDAQYGPAMAILSRQEQVLWLAGPAASASRPLPDGRRPGPGGWNRIVIQVQDVASTVADLRQRGVRFRGNVIEGPGGTQALCEDPSGNVVELFQATQ
jgi:catechol 2,3-dioxygenase-like lactoylglutathione lyase family enzyme